MFSLQEICRKNIYFLPVWLSVHVFQRLRLYWEKHGSLQRIGDDYVLIQQDLIIPINAALRMAGEEGSVVVVQLLLLWEGNIHYAIIRALEGVHYTLLRMLYVQIEDCHDILPLFQDPKIFAKCHVLHISCIILCLVLHAVQNDMPCILQDYTTHLCGEDIQVVFATACRSQKYDIVRWMGQNIAIYNPEVIFIIAFVTIYTTLLSIRYTLLFNHRIYIMYANIVSLLSQHLVWAAGMGLLHFMLETLQYGGDVSIPVLSVAVQYVHRKVLHYFLRRKNLYQEDLAELLLLAIRADCSTKTLYLLLSYLYYSIYNIRTKILQCVQEYATTIIIQILWKRKIYLLRPILADFIRYHTYTYMVHFMRVFSIHPEKMFKMAARESREDLFIQFSKNVCKEPTDTLHYLKSLLYTMRHTEGKQLLFYTIHILYKACHLQSTEMFILARFYARHIAVFQFISICQDLSKLYIIIKNLLLQCLWIAITKNYPQLIRTIQTDMCYVLNFG
uniref:p505_5R n=1 Tax=African swine fever virus TaxID=10497 RepID=A0A6G7KTM4_ASF